MGFDRQDSHSDSFGVHPRQRLRLDDPATQGFRSASMVCGNSVGIKNSGRILNCFLYSSPQVLEFGVIGCMKFWFPKSNGEVVGGLQFLIGV